MNKKILLFLLLRIFFDATISFIMIPAFHYLSIMQISFEIGKMKIPLKFIGKSSGVDMEELKSEGTQTGSVYLRFYNYEVNSFLNDSIFIDSDDKLE